MKRKRFLALVLGMAIAVPGMSMALFGEYPCTDHSDCIFAIQERCNLMNLYYMGSEWSYGECSGYCMDSEDGWIWRITACGGWSYPPALGVCPPEIRERGRYYLTPTSGNCADLLDWTIDVVNDWNCANNVNRCLPPEERGN